VLTQSDLDVISETLAPLVRSAEISLLLGSGFSMGNKSIKGEVPGSDALKMAILAECRREPGTRTTLKDAYVLGDREIPDFGEFLRSLFTVESVPTWQQRIFSYAWRRIYTTNIDNVLEVACRQQQRLGRLGADFNFFNYSDASLSSESLGSVPVVSIHGSCSRLSDGFIFSSLEYAMATAKVHDWHRDLAARALTGGLLVVGNQLEESDLDAYIADRSITYGLGDVPRNWLVTPDPDPIKLENYRAAGYHVFDATAEEFFLALFSAAEPKTMADIVLETIPSVAGAVRNQKAMTWFRTAMDPVLTSIEQAHAEKGLLRHFLTGDEPEWFYIVNSAYAPTARDTELTRTIGDLMTSNATGVGMLHVIGPSGSGKTTGIRVALEKVSRSNPYIYEFKNGGAIDLDLLRETISRFTGKSIFVFYSAHEFYYAISYISDHFGKSQIPFCLFILEDRVGDYRRNRAQLRRPTVSSVFELSELSIADAKSIAHKIEAHGLVFDNFSDLALDRRAKLIVDKERGYGGDLLTTLFSLTTHENFEAKIYQDYVSIRNAAAREALEAVAIVNALGFNVPVHYAAGFIDISQSAFQELVSKELAGVLVYVKEGGYVRCRHKIIAKYYFDQCISKQGSSSLILKILRFLSRQFTVADIRHHPLPYRIYKEIVSFEFLFGSYFAQESRLTSTEMVYHEAQKLFGRDGIFWLHFGRFYRKTNRLDEAIECFRTGLSYFVSFQTNHQLGVALLERYAREGFIDKQDYEEGIEILEAERASRATTDPFPTGTLIHWLRKIVAGDGGNEDAASRLRNAISYGMKHFQDDQFVRDQIREHFSMNGRG